MKRHPYFDLLLHEDKELAELLGDDIRERVTLHEWPLSCVQRVTGASGRKVIYKAESGPSVEPVFYASAKSPLLIKGETIFQQGPYACLLLEYLEGSSLEKQPLGEAETVALGKNLLSQIGGIQGQLPCTLDITNRERWQEYFRDILEGLERLVEQGIFVVVDREIIAWLERWAFCEATLSVIDAHPGYVHHDLGGDNIFRIPGGWKVIDWQRPIRGPVELDLVSLLESMGHDPARHVPEAAVWMLRFTRIGWMCECTQRWFPPGADTYDRTIARLAGQVGYAPSTTQTPNGPSSATPSW